MKIHELITEESEMIKSLKSFAKTHYTDVSDDTEALMLFFARSLMHAKEDDERQNHDIKDLQNQISDIKSQIKAGK